MDRQTISPDRWTDVIDQFSRAHHGKQARVTLNDPSFGTRRYFTNQPLFGLIHERDGKKESITVILGESRDGTSSHSLSRPQRLELAEWNDAYSAELEIESFQGQRLNIQVGPAEQLLSPGMILDGILLEERS